MLQIECPICKSKIVVGMGFKLYDDSTKQADIDRHMRRHTLGELMEFMETSFAEQLNAIEAGLEYLASKENNKTNGANQQ